MYSVLKKACEPAKETSNDMPSLKTYRKAYQACLACRQMKQKCVQDVEVDGKTLDKCYRCTRKRIPCVFVARKSHQKKILKNVLKADNTDKSFATEVDVENLMRNNEVSPSKLSQEKAKNETSQVSTTHGALNFLAQAAGKVSQQQEEQQPQKPLMSLPADKHKKTLKDMEYIPFLLSEYEARKFVELFFITLHPFYPFIPIHFQDCDELCKYPLLLCAILTISSRYHTFEEIYRGQDYGPENNTTHIEVHEKLWTYCQMLFSQTIWAEASTRSIGTVFAFLLFTEWNPRAIHWKCTDYATGGLGVMNFQGSGYGNNDKSAQSMRSTGNGLAPMRRSDRLGWNLSGAAIRLAQDMNFIDTSCKIFLASHISEINIALSMNKMGLLRTSFANIDLKRTVRDQMEDSVDPETFVHCADSVNCGECHRWDYWKSKFYTGNVQYDSLFLKEFFEDDKSLYRIDPEDTEYLSNKKVKNDKLQFSAPQLAKLEILKIMSLGYDSIYNDKMVKYIKDAVYNLNTLSVLHELMESWYMRYAPLFAKKCNSNGCIDLAKMSDGKYVMEVTRLIDAENLCMDYYYCQLYIYSLSFEVVIIHSGKSIIETDTTELDAGIKYLELAFNAANEIIGCGKRLYSVGMLRYAPVRLVSRIVRSIAFIVKCFMTFTNKKSSLNSSRYGNPNFNNRFLFCYGLDKIVQMIKDASFLMKETSPDEIHLGTKYSAILEFLYKKLDKTVTDMNQSENTEEKTVFSNDNKNNNNNNKNNNNKNNKNNKNNNNNNIIGGESNSNGTNESFKEPLFTNEYNNAATFNNTDDDLLTWFDSINAEYATATNTFDNSVDFNDATLRDGNINMNNNKNQTTNTNNTNNNTNNTNNTNSNDYIGLNFVDAWTEMINEHIE